MIEEFVTFPLEDIEVKWKYSASVSHYKEGKVVEAHRSYEHSDYPDLLRIIDIENEAIYFFDRKRIEPENIIDINKPLPHLRKIRLMTQIVRVMNAEKPVTMPYTPEKLKVYIEDLDGYFGILYYRVVGDEEKNIVSVKRFFKIEKGVVFTEVNFSEYQKYKEENYVDSNTEQAEDN